MDIRIKATDYTMTPETSAYLDERLSTVERHLGDDAEKARLEIEVGRSAKHSQNGENWFTEIQIRIPGGNYSRVVGTGETLMVSIDMAKDEMLRKLRTSKKEQTGFLRKSGAAFKKFLRME